MRWILEVCAHLIWAGFMHLIWDGVFIGLGWWERFAQGAGNEIACTP